MANQLEEVLVTAKRISNDIGAINPPSAKYNLEKFKNQDLLKSCKYAFWLLNPPNILKSYYNSFSMRDFTLATESIEFPGKNMSTIDYRIPGKQKIRVPNFREYNEITLTFYHSTDFPMYQFFSDWMDMCAPNTAANAYYDDLVTDELQLIQLTDNLSAAFTLYIRRAYPLNFTSMASSWADDNFQRMSVTFFYEEFDMQDYAAGIVKKGINDVISGNQPIDSPMTTAVGSNIITPASLANMA